MLTKIKKYSTSHIAKLQGESLKAKSARGALVLAAGTFVERGMRLVRNMILARLLAPEDFGLMAIILAVMLVMESFADVGIQQSVIHNKNGASYEYLNVAWWFQVLRGSGLFVIAFFAAPLVCNLYEKPELLNLLRVIFLGTLFFNLSSTRLYVLEKEFKFTKSVLLIQGVTLLSNLLTIILAFNLRSVWVLVIGRVAEGALRFLLSFVFCPFMPSFHFDRRSFKELFKYSKGMFGLSLLTIIALQIDVFILAKLVSTEKVGMYALALSLAVQPVALFGQTVGRILLPAFSERQDNKQALCSIVLRIIRYTWIFGVPLLMVVVVFAKPILSVIYGHRYSEVAVTFGILCFVSFFRIQGSVLANIFFALGKPHLHRRFVILLAVLIICLIYPAIVLGGLEGAAGAILLANVVAICMQVIWLKEIIGLRFRDFFYSWTSSYRPSRD